MQEHGGDGMCGLPPRQCDTTTHLWVGLKCWLSYFEYCKCSAALRAATRDAWAWAQGEEEEEEPYLIP